MAYDVSDLLAETLMLPERNRDVIFASVNQMPDETALDQMLIGQGLNLRNESLDSLWKHLRAGEGAPLANLVGQTTAMLERMGLDANQAKYGIEAEGVQGSIDETLVGLGLNMSDIGESVDDRMESFYHGVAEAYLEYAYNGYGQTQQKTANRKAATPSVSSNSMGSGLVGGAIGLMLGSLLGGAMASASRPRYGMGYGPMGMPVGGMGMPMGAPIRPVRPAPPRPVMMNPMGLGTAMVNPMGMMRPAPNPMGVNLGRPNGMSLGGGRPGMGRPGMGRPNGFGIGGMPAGGRPGGRSGGPRRPF